MQPHACAIELGLALLKPSPESEAEAVARYRCFFFYPERRLSWDLLLSQVEISCARKVIFQKPCCHRVKCLSMSKCLAKLNPSRTLFLLEKLLLGQVCRISVLHCSVYCIYLTFLAWPSLLWCPSTHDLDFYSCSLLQGGNLMQSSKRERTFQAAMELADTACLGCCSINLNCCGWVKHPIFSSHTCSFWTVWVETEGSRKRVSGGFVSCWDLVWLGSVWGW